MRKENGEEVRYEEPEEELVEEEYEQYQHQAVDDEGYASEERFSATLRYPRGMNQDHSFIEVEEGDDSPQHHMEDYYAGHSVDAGDQTPIGGNSRNDMMSWNSSRRR